MSYVFLLKDLSEGWNEFARYSNTDNGIAISFQDENKLLWNECLWKDLSQIN